MAGSRSTSLTSRASICVPLVLQVDIAQTQLSLEVIYGDTDSVMINTGIASRDEFAAAFGDRPAEDERQRIEQEKEKLKEVRHHVFS